MPLVATPSCDLQPLPPCSVSMMSRAGRHRIENRKLTPAECKQVAEKCANASARIALKDWYAFGLDQANELLPDIQINENLELLKTFPDWKATKHARDGYIMLKSMFNTRKPVAIRLDYEAFQAGGLTYGELHTQLREHLSLTLIDSLRVCPYKPWYHHKTTSSPVPESRALPNNKSQCRHLLGTTLIYLTYIHLHDPVQTQMITDVPYPGCSWIP